MTTIFAEEDSVKRILLPRRNNENLTITCGLLRKQPVLSLWILVEGETDAFLCEELARLLGLDLFASGVCCVEYSVIGVYKLIRLSFSSAATLLR